MLFHRIKPHILLRSYIEKMWLFKSSGKMPAADMNLVVPNGNLKLTISYRNGIIAALSGKTFASNEHDITLTGMIDVPVVLDVARDAVAETIGIEFSPHGAYRFFHLPLLEVRNQIHSLTDVLGKNAKDLTNEIVQAQPADQKIDLLQQFLLHQLSLREEDPIFEYCAAKIIASNGSISIRELERQTGYSSRWLNMKFKDKLGVSPKNLASILRFRHCYGTLINGTEASALKNGFYELYYDQSHFIREFKRFTGLPPARFEKLSNSFGEEYYRG